MPAPEAVLGHKRPAAGQRNNPQAHRTGLIVVGALRELRRELGSRTVGKLLYAALASNP